MLISDNLPLRKSYFDSYIIRIKIQGYYDIFSMNYFEADVASSQMFTCDVIKARKLNTIGIKHGFSCINVCQIPREMLKTEAEGRGF